MLPRPLPESEAVFVAMPAVLVVWARVLREHWFNRHTALRAPAPVGYDSPSHRAESRSRESLSYAKKSVGHSPLQESAPKAQPKTNQVTVSAQLLFQNASRGTVENRPESALIRNLSGIIQIAVNPCLVFRKTEASLGTRIPPYRALSAKNRPFSPPDRKPSPQTPGGYDNRVSRR